MRLSRKSRKYQRRINRSKTIESLQSIANEVQVEYDSREITHTEAIVLGNQIQLRADSIDNTQLVYAISDRDTYRRLIEVYLDDGILTRTEQILLWDERRKLGISQESHDSLLASLIARYQKQNRPIHVQSMPLPRRDEEQPEE
ncbi:MAG TPA: hypothetical protein QF716_01455 [Candidatus Thalassarchaeaceae archaeon]|jgi:hypothetical protein|nr:hypothetical protein [Candidatus Thalassarchaeaceae archaeon]HJM67527.1 hypothetical protein [Candidatus Thalassarchaeaceae archaeon]